MNQSITSNKICQHLLNVTTCSTVFADDAGEVCKFQHPRWSELPPTSRGHYLLVDFGLMSITWPDNLCPFRDGTKTGGRGSSLNAYITIWNRSHLASPSLIEMERRARTRVFLLATSLVKV